jgi:hypothetical protein
MEFTDEERGKEFDFDSLVQLTQASGRELRLRIHAEQNEICPLLKIKIPVEDTALDHKHKRKQDPCGPNGDGLVRGVISFRANSLEGKIANAWKRQFGYDTNKHPVPLPDFLRNLADYLEYPPIEQIYVHPTEKVKRPKLQASKFNLVKRYWKYLYPRRKMPTFPKSGKVTEEFKLYMEQADGFDNSVKNGTIKKLGLRDKKKIENYLLLNKKVKAPTFMGAFITEDIEKILLEISKVN